jgi:hypothetical protein
MAEEARVKYGLYVVALGLGSLLIAMCVALYKWNTISDVTALISAVGAVIGPIVGAFFGLNIGAAGKAKADQDRDKAVQDRDQATKKVEALMGAIQPAEFAKLKSDNANLF